MVGRDNARPARTRARRERAISSQRNAQPRTQSVPVALTVAGSDSSAGAGLQADLKTFAALGVYGLTAVSCIVAETPGKVSRIEVVSSEILREQIAVLAESFQIAAIKTGLLYSAEIISAVAQALRNIGMLPLRRTGFQPALVIDPVISATSGEALLRADAINIYEKELFPLATLITPNLPEAEKLLSTPIIDLKAMWRAGRKLEAKYQTSILLKGGHLAQNNAVDLLFQNGKVTEFSAPFVRGVATHGTGCTYSAAITAGLASGLTLEDAIGRAKKFVSATIARHFRWTRRSRRSLDALNHSALL
jgi:hydroxymethylpyrimidine/phosphomethylpyrimidine kinase